MLTYEDNLQHLCSFESFVLAVRPEGASIVINKRAAIELMASGRFTRGELDCSRDQRHFRHILPDRSRFDLFWVFDRFRLVYSPCEIALQSSWSTFETMLNTTKSEAQLHRVQPGYLWSTGFIPR